jgi:hypothetical protein
MGRGQMEVLDAHDLRIKMHVRFYVGLFEDIEG